ncbi:MAG: (2Fe-2S)-binding protein [Magnetovibrionaceae bacterium]
MAKLMINGQSTEVDVDGETPLLWVVREQVGLTGTKFGCGAALCGACTVLVNGEPVRSCSTAVSDVEGQEITTIEGLQTPAAQAVQAAWTKLDVPQCGYCQSGQVMAASALLENTPKPTDADIDEAMNGNVCRCATYVRIRAAIHEASRIMAAG